ncbi:hypothetical protein ACLO87_03840 [Paenalcaligenes sp. Me52]|uniref:hypothetical protein n=1 Tax=Paenalcaligenes sp. Me52 TaxID=3392038 RepID=UPI003D2BEF22
MNTASQSTFQHSTAMRPKGQKTKSTYFWLTEDDVTEFSGKLHDALPSLSWRCSHPSPDHLVVHHFDSVSDALRCGASPFVSQAFVEFEFSVLQFLFFQPKTLSHVIDNYAPGYRYPPTINMVECGRMAIRWNTQDGDELAQAELATQLKLIWKVFQQTTLPAKVQATAGYAVSGFRIGKHMLEKVKTESLYLKANGPFCVLSES